MTYNDRQVGHYKEKMSPKIVNKVEKKKEILGAARKVFAQKGFASSKMEDIAREAGMGKGTVYEYFRSKEDIFLALFEEIKAAFYQRIFIIDKQLPAREILKVFIASSLNSFEEWSDVCHIFLDFWAEHKRAGFSQFRFDEFYKEGKEKLAALIQEGINQGAFKPVNPMYTASLITAVIDGLLLQWVLNPKGLALKDLAPDIIETILTGMEEKKSP